MSDGVNDDIMDASNRARGFRTNLLRSRIDERSKRESMRAESMPSEEELAREKDAEENKPDPVGSGSDAFRSHYKGRKPVKADQGARSPLARLANFSMIGVLLVGALGMAYWTLLKEPDKVVRAPTKRTPLRPKPPKKTNPDGSEGPISIPQKKVEKKTPAKPKARRPKPRTNPRGKGPKRSPARPSGSGAFGRGPEPMRPKSVTADMVTAPPPLPVGADFIESSEEHQDIADIAEAFIAKVTEISQDLMASEANRRAKRKQAEDAAVAALKKMTSDDPEEEDLNAPVVFDVMEQYIDALGDHPFQLILAKALASKEGPFAQGIVQDLVASDATSTKLKWFMISSMPSQAPAADLISTIWDRVNDQQMRIDMLNTFDGKTAKRSDDPKVQAFFRTVATAENEDPVVRARALMIIGRRRSATPADYDALSRIAADSPQMGVRAVALQVLAYVYGEQSLGMLSNIAQNTDPKTIALRKAIIEAAEDLGAPAIPLMRKISESDPSDELRAAAGKMANKLEGRFGG